jgi:integrase
MARGCKKSGVKKIRVHDVRHSHASLLIELGFSPLLISERLGHENVETTLEIYTHLYPDKHGEVSSKLNELFSPKINQKADRNPGNSE